MAVRVWIAALVLIAALAAPLGAWARGVTILRDPDIAHGPRALARPVLNAAGLSRVLGIFRGQEALATSRRDPNVLRHPLSRARIRAVKGFVAATADKLRARPDDANRFARVHGKPKAFVGNPANVLRRLPKGDTPDISRMRRAAALVSKNEPKLAPETPGANRRALKVLQAAHARAGQRRALCADWPLAGCGAPCQTGREAFATRRAGLDPGPGHTDRRARAWPMTKHTDNRRRPPC